MADEEYSRSSAGDDEFEEPIDTGEDYEGTLDEEEGFEAEDYADELKDLADEGEMSIEELRKKYGVPANDEDSASMEADSSAGEEGDKDSDEELQEDGTHLLDRLAASANDAEDLEDDKDYEPPSWWYKSVRIDPIMYQADVPLINDESAIREDFDRPLWVPTPSLTDDAIDYFLQSVTTSKEGAILTRFDAEDALYALFANEFDTSKAEAAQPFFHVNSPRLTVNEDNGSWDSKEMDTFESAMNSHGKDFQLIRASFPGRKVGELVQFYYTWKKTDRYKNYKRKQLQPDIDYHTFTASILNPHHPPHPGQSVHEHSKEADTTKQPENDVNSWNGDVDSLPSKV